MSTFASAPHVSWDIRRSSIGSIPDERLRQLAQYWFSRRDVDAMPLRSAIDPLHFPALLPNIMLLERSGEPPDERFRFRLAGTDVVEHIGREPTGRHLDEILPASYHDYVRLLNRIAIDEARPVYSSSLYHDEGRFVNAITYRLVMPLLGRDRTPLMFVCQFWQRRADRGWWSGDWRSVAPEITVIADPEQG